MIQNLKKGQLLIADPSILDDISFGRSVVLLTEYSKNSAVGFVINKPSIYKVNDLIPEINCDFTVYQGGPVEQDNLYFIHQIPQYIPESHELSNGLYWGGNFEKLESLLNNQQINSDEIRFFLGYSGWGANQLEDEIALKSWHIANNNYSNLFSVSEKQIWKKELLKKGEEFKLWVNAPNNYLLN